VLRKVFAAVVVGLFVVALAGAGILVHESVSIAAPSFGEIVRGGGITQADGLLPDGVTAFDSQFAGVANLRADLLSALRAATTIAARNGVEIFVNSGWRSRGYQAELVAEAVTEYGSQKEAARWVATPDTSPHVSGNAVDVGHGDADAWLSANGAQFGLCQIYRNEPWHFELRPNAIADGCPGMYADPTHDPRMQ
jgi:D-alanyl-D-alanine carboxypeptidase